MILRILARAVLVGLSSLVILVTTSAAVADYYYQQALAANRKTTYDVWAVGRIDMAIRFNPINSEYFYRRHSLLRDADPTAALAALDKAIRLEPSKDIYHAYRALLQQKKYPRPSQDIRAEIRMELVKAYELKPLSGTYKKYLGR